MLFLELIGGEIVLRGVEQAAAAPLYSRKLHLVTRDCGGLTMLSLRDCQTESQKSTNAPRELTLPTAARETAYRGKSNRWSELPGCFERHLQRKEGNPLFPASQRHPTDKAVTEAQATDMFELDHVKSELLAVADIAEKLQGRLTIVAAMKFLTAKVVPLFQKTAWLGEAGVGILGGLENVHDVLVDSMADVIGGEDGRKLKQGIRDINSLRLLFFRNVFLAQTMREHTPIAQWEFVPALLCESIETFGQALEALSTVEANEEINAVCSGAPQLVENAARRGFVFSGAEEKLALLDQYVRARKSVLHSTARVSTQSRLF
jgi:hypothetical protein